MAATINPEITNSIVNKVLYINFLCILIIIQCFFRGYMLYCCIADRHSILLQIMSWKHRLI